MPKPKIKRRTLLKAGLGTAASSMLLTPFSSLSAKRPGIMALHGKETDSAVYYEITIKREPLLMGMDVGYPITLNRQFPGPLIRLKEGKDAIIRVTNKLDESTSIHWHGIIIPYQMDGVPGVVFPGIDPGETFTYHFPVRQSGTYWYHSHTGLQEQLGHYGPLICDPIEPDPYHYDREHVVVLSDWTFEEPEAVLMHLKKWEGYYNYQKRTIVDLFNDMSRKGFINTVRARAMWARMRMNPRDIADITGAIYTYLINGFGPDENHALLFRPGERVRLRIINASASTYFDFRIPGLKMTVVQADGQNVEPVEVDEFRIAVAETYDVIVKPEERRPYALFAEAMDRSGFGLASLTFSRNILAKAPPRRPPLERGMEAMDMDMKMDGQMDKMKMGQRKDLCGHCSPKRHRSYPFGPDAAMVVNRPRCMVDNPGSGLSGTTRRVLCYADLKPLEPYPQASSSPDKTIEIHLTGNMERFIWKMWAWDGKRWSSRFEDLLDFPLGKRVRIIFINHTMMDHPIHLHGMWMRVQNGCEPFLPRKHTVNIKPAEKLCVEVDADAFGNWAFHCHILYHMHTGMFRVVRAC